MTDKPPLDSPRSVNDPELERLLTSQLARAPLSAEALERLHTSVSQAWRETPALTRVSPPHGTVGGWKRWAGLAAAASVVATVLTLLALRPAVEREQFGIVARSTDGGLEVRGTFFRRHRVRVGEAIQVGDAVESRGSALVELGHGGTLRVAPASAMIVVTASELALKHGLIYVDKPPGLTEFARLHVSTRAGLVEHVGTEFELKSDDQVVRIRVREGQVRFFGASGAQTANAGTELSALSGGRLVTRPVPSFGRAWEWTTALAPEFAIEGRPLIEFLQWASRELGCTLDFADARARDTASSTILHGSIQGEIPGDALANILASTTLSFELAEGSLRIRSSR